MVMATLMRLGSKRFARRKGRELQRAISKLGQNGPGPAAPDGDLTEATVGKTDMMNVENRYVESCVDAMTHSCPRLLRLYSIMEKD